jgi:hypothetical protein
MLVYNAFVPVFVLDVDVGYKERRFHWLSDIKLKPGRE